MLPSLNFNPSFANLAALHGLGGGMPHPIGPVGVRPITENPPVSGWGGPMPAPMPGMPGYPGMLEQGGMPGQFPQGNLSNLHALMQMFGQRQQAAY